MEAKHIKKAFLKCGIKPGDSLFIHGDAGAVAQIKVKSRNKINYFFKYLKEYVGREGNIIIPTFTYSACKEKKFDINKNISETGLFSEIFRNQKYTKRTNHPIFSCAIYGKKYKYFDQAKITTCFGSDSIFERFLKLNGTIVCIGCSLDRITFTHYAEEIFKVNYRYHKNFKIYLTKKKKYIDIDYYVRKLTQNSRIDLSKLNKYLITKKRIKEINFGRYKLITVKSKDFFKSCLELLSKNKNSLVKKNNQNL